MGPIPSESADIDRALGSRHRAALGMSLELDGIVIVVSEETGTISVASNGSLRRGLTVDQLNDILWDELVASKNRAEHAASNEEDDADTITAAESRSDDADVSNVSIAPSTRETVGRS